jgi:hypothetical protein
VINVQVSSRYKLSSTTTPSNKSQPLQSYPILAHVLLSSVQARCGGNSFEPFAALQAHAPDLRVLLSQLGAASGHASIPIRAIQEALEERAAEWGAAPGSLAALLHPERLFSGAVALDDWRDESGEVCLSKGEVFAALDPQVTLKRACRSVQHQLPQVKAAFARLAIAHGCAATDGAAAGEGATPLEKTQSSVAAAYGSLDAAAVPDAPTHAGSEAKGQGRATSDGDGHVYAALAVDDDSAVRVALRVDAPPDPHAGVPAAAPLATARVPLAAVHAMLRDAVQDASSGYGVLFSDVADALSAERFDEYAAFAGIGGGRERRASGVSWPEFVGTVLHCLNR